MASINYSTTSDRQTASAQIATFSGALCGVDMQPPTSGQATLYIYDSEDSSTAGKKLIAEVFVDAGMPGMQQEYFVPVVVNRGIYCTLTGSNASYIVRFFLG